MSKQITWIIIVTLVINAIGTGLMPAPVAAAPVTFDASAALPAWYTEAPASDLLPKWFLPADRQPISGDRHPPAGPARRNLARSIPIEQLTVDVTGPYDIYGDPTVASVGAPQFEGETYQAVIRNTSSEIAYGIYLTATHETFLEYDGSSELISRTGEIDISTNYFTPGEITWTPVTTYNLAPDETITLTFDMRATCEAESGKRLEVGVRYNADPPPATPDELNTGGLNVTTGHGNLTVVKSPALQDLDSEDFGDPITWTIQVQNTGLGIIYNAVITDNGGANLDPPVFSPPISTTIEELDINESQTFTVVGTIEACNFTNIAEAAWPCGNLEGDGTAANPVSSTVSVLFHPQVPKVSVDVSSPITFPYCAPNPATVAIIVENQGGPAGAFNLASSLDDSSLNIIPSTISPSNTWTYSATDGSFTYVGGSPTGTLAAYDTVTLTFQVTPGSPPCSEGGGSVVFTPQYRDVCSDEPFTGQPVSLAYEEAQGQAPSLGIAKAGPDSVASGEVFTYQVTVSGVNPQNISGTVHVTDTLPDQFEIYGPFTTSLGSASTGVRTIIWTIPTTHTASLFTETLVYAVQAITDTEGACGAGQMVDNQAEAFARPTCPSCDVFTPTAEIETIIENSEGVSPTQSAAGSFEVCGSTGFTISNRYEIAGSTIVTWAGAVFTEALGTGIGDGALPGGEPLEYRNALSVTINGDDYTDAVTATVVPGGQLSIDLGGLGASGAPTQHFTLHITYTVGISEASLNGAVEQTFYDWSQLYLPNSASGDVCAGNDAFNQAYELTIGRGDLSVGLAPRVLDRCETNRAVIQVTDNAPARLADHVVVTFTSSSAEIATARNFATTGALPDISFIDVVTDTGNGLITFTFPSGYDSTGDGTIQFDIDVGCTEEAPWQAGITFRTRCGFSHRDEAQLNHSYRKPNMILFATPIEYTLREREPTWKFFVTNNGNLTATNVVVTNTAHGLTITNFVADGPDVTATLPAETAIFTIGQIAPGQQREITVTAEAFRCTPLSVDIAAQLDCFGVQCGYREATIEFNTPSPYLRTNNGETADLPMCQIGEVIFTTKNASPDTTLYQLNITETLKQLEPAPGKPITVTVFDDENNQVALTTSFTPTEIISDAETTMLVWRAVSATNTAVYTWFDALPPKYIVRIFVPVRTSCVPPDSPRSFAQADAQGPCGQRLGYTEDAVTLQTQKPDMALRKRGRVVGGDWWNTVHATPGQTVTWQIMVDNRQSTHSYLAENVVLSDTWPIYFDFITATTDYNPTLVTSTRTITWNLGTVAPADDPLYFYITGTVVTTETACQGAAPNKTLLRYGCDYDGCNSGKTPIDSADLDSRPDLTVDLRPGALPICEGQIPVRVRNYGAQAHTATLTVTLPAPGYEVYSYTITPASEPLTPTAVAAMPTHTPWFKWDVIPGRTGPSPYQFDVTLMVRNSGNSGACPDASAQPVSATLTYDASPICTNVGPFTTTDSTSLNVLTPELDLSKTPQAQNADVGEWVTWTIAVTNTGSGIARNLVITDVVGSNYLSTSITGSVGSDGALPTVISATNTIYWVPDTLAGSRINGNVHALAVYSDTVYVGGDFSIAGGVSVNNVAQWDGRNWSTLDSGVTGPVYALAVDTSGNLYVGGDFENAGGVSVDNVAVWDGSSWSALGSGVDDVVRALAVEGNDVYVGGDFYSAGGTTAYYVARWEVGSSSWYTLARGVYGGDGGRVNALVMDGSDLYVGGDFYIAGYSPYVYVDNVARWDGSSWHALPNESSGPDKVVRTLVMDKNSDLYVGGDFEAIDIYGGSDVDADYLAVWDGSSWSTLSSEVNNRVRALAVYSDSFYAGGDFGNVGDYVARWDGSSWFTLASGVNNRVRALAVEGESVYVGGDFTRAGGQTASRVAKWNAEVGTWSALGNVWTATVSAQLLSAGNNRNVVTATARCATGCETAVVSDTASTTVLRDLDKGPEIQTGTIGSLAVFTFTTILGDGDALYEDLILTDTLPTGLGYVSSTLVYVPDVDGGGTPVVSHTPTITPGGTYTHGHVVWRLGDLPGTVQLDGVITTVIQDIDANYEGISMTNVLTMSYTDDGQDYVYTDTADVDVVEPLLHIGKTYVTPRGCGATLLQDNFNDGGTGAWSALGTWNVDNGIYKQMADNTNRRAFTGERSWTDYSYSFMMKTSDPNGSMGGYVRQDSSSTADRGYLFRWMNSQMRLERRDTFELLDSNPADYKTNRWYHVEIRVTGDLIEVFVDGISYLSATDVTHPIGRVGLLSSSHTETEFDDVLVTRLDDMACTVGANDLVTYTLTISNQARWTGHNLVVTDSIPAGMSFSSYTMVSDDPNSTVTTELNPGDTGTLIWHIDQLTATSPFSATDHTALKLTVVLAVSDGITANVVLPNQAALAYDGQPDDGPVGVQRDYSGGSHSTAVRTVDSGIAKTTRFSPPPTATLGTLVTYTLIVPTPPISATLYDVVVTDTLDSRLYIEGVTTDGGTGTSADWDGQTVTATFDAIDHHTQAFITVTARISHAWPSAAGDANAGEIITNHAVMTHATATEITRTETVSTEVGEPDVNVVKSVASSTAVTTDLDGEALLTYTLRLENAGSSPAYSLHITDAVPAGISVTAQYGGDARSGPVVGAGTLTWTLDTLDNVPPANVTLLTYTAHITRALSDDVLTNTVDLRYHSLTETIPGVRPYTDTDDADVETAPPGVAKATDPATLRVGDIVTYHLVFTIPAGTVGMGGNSYLADTLPPGVWAITDSEQMAWTPSAVGPITFTDRTFGTDGDSQTVTWTFGEPITSRLDTSTVITLTFQAQATGVDADGDRTWWPNHAITHAITNTVELTQRGDVIDEDDATNEVIQPDLRIDKDSLPPSGSTVARGEAITYTLTITNAGHGPAYDVVVTDTLPVGIDYVRTISAPNPGTAIITPVVDGRAITYTVSELAAGPGATMRITVVARVTDTIGANLLLTNTAAITTYDSQPGEGPGPRQPDEREYEDGEDDVVHRTVDAAITKAVTPTEATLGDLLTYTIHVPEPPITATLYDVTVADTLDARLQLHTVTAPGGSVVTADNAFTVTYASILSLTQRLIIVTAVLSDPLNAYAGDVISNVAILTHRDGGPTPSEEPPFTVTEPSLTLVKASDPPTSNTVGAGDHVTYTVTITNASGITASVAHDLAFTDTLPVGMRTLPPTLVTVTLDSAPVATGDYVTGYQGSTGVLTITFNAGFSVPVDGELGIVYVAHVDSNVGSTFDMPNRAEVVWSSLPGSTPGDRDYGPITDTTTVHTVLPGLDKDVTPTEATLGDLITYTIDVPTRPITATLYAITVTDRLDDRLRLHTVVTDGVDGAVSVAGNRFTVTYPTIPHGEQRTITVTAVLSDPLGADRGDVITNQATMTHSNGTAVSDRPVFTVTEPSIAIQKTGSVAAADPREAIYTLTLVNSGDSPAYSLVITDRLPAGLQAIDASHAGQISTDGRAITWTVDTLDVPPPPQNTLNLTYTARLSQVIYDGTRFTNTAVVTTTSLTDTVPGVRTYTETTEHELNWPLGRLGDYVWYDFDYDGVQGSVGAEFPISDVVLNLYDAADPGTLIATDTTDIAGLYLFEHLPLSTTYVVQVAPESYAPGGPLETYSQTLWTVGTTTPVSDSNASITQTFGAGDDGYAVTTTLTLNPVFTEDLSLDYGFVKLVEIGNYVWFDEDNDGVQDDDPGNGFGGVTVTVGYPDGRVFTTTTTSNGYYTFTVPVSHTYAITVVADNFAPGGPLEAYTHTLPNAGSNDAVDSDGEPDSASGGLVTTTPIITEDNYTFDFGLVRLVSLGNYVWFDTNDDGITDTTESGVSGVAVELYQDSDTSGDFTPGVDRYISATTTNANGYYTFTQLYPSLAPSQAYVVVITGTNFTGSSPLVDYQSSTGAVGGNSDLNDRDHGVVSGTLGSGGLVASTPVSVTAGDEPPYLGHPDGDSDDGSNLTIDFGFYRLSLGDQVWYDDDNDGLLNGGESGAAGVTVNLYDSTGTTILDTTATDGSGFYTFTGLYSGTGYVVEIVPPATYTSSTDIASSDNPLNNVNSDDNGVNWVGGHIRSNPITLTAGYTGTLNNNTVDDAAGATHDPTVDFGLVQQLSLGNYVWFDTDDDGVVDAGEAGVPGVAVELYQDSDESGDLTPGDRVISSTTTDGSGHYTFINLLPSRDATETFLVVITATNFTSGGPLEGYVNSTGYVGGNSDRNDEDHGIRSGALGSGGLVASTPVSLTVGDEPTDDGDSDANSNLTLDFGFYQLSLGDQVWYDDDNDGRLDSGESGAVGITVNLYDSTGTTILDTTATDGNGYYTFTGLYSGTGYVVEIVPLATYTSSTDIATSDNPLNNVDSDDNGVTWDGGHIRSNPITLTAGYDGAQNNNIVDDATGSTHDPTVDFGLVQQLSLGNYVWYDTNDDGITATTESGIGNVDVELYLDSDGSGDFAPGDQFVDRTATDATGHYTFTGLLPSRYPTETYLVVITATNFAPGGPLEGYSNSTGAVDGNSDLNDRDHGVLSGTLGGGGLVASTPVSLTVGDEPDGTPTPDGDSDPNSNLTIDFGFYRMDLGDLPEGPYPTTLSQNGARHVILPVDNPTLGSIVDAEIDGQPDDTATGDDVAQVTPNEDDEDGVRLDSALIAGQVATMTITGTHVSGAFLNAWLDFDGDGSLEQVFTDTTLAAGANALTFTVPTVVLSDTVNGRFRFSTQGGLSPTGRAPDGEIEDHQFTPTPMDLGDLPEGPYPTTLSQNGARHVILPVGNPTLGTTVDDELDGQPNVTADGDDEADTDDEDGVTFSGPLVPGEDLTATVSTTADADGLLNAWLDFDGDGSLTGSGEQIAANRTITAGERITLVLPVPLTATQGITTYARFRFSTEPDLAPTGLATDGEVEDYALPIREMDYGDAPDIDYRTVYTSDGARHVILPVDNPTLGSVVDAETDGQPSAGADGDDTTNTDDEDGVSFDSDLVPGEVATITVSAAPTATGVLNAWIDFGGDGDWNEAIDQIVTNQTITAGDNVIITFTVPSTAIQNTTYARFRFSTQPDLAPTGLAPDGEVEDYRVGVQEMDYGDLPDDSVPGTPDYPTQNADDGGRHIILEANNPTLGAIVDAETEGQPSAAADGDDVNDGSDDEDGVTFSGPLIPGEEITITVSATETTGLLNAWLDFDGDGSLTDSGEQIVLNETITAGESITLVIPVPLTATQGITTYARFRFSTDSDLTPTGLASDGEIEDYALNTLRLDYGDLPDDGFSAIPGYATPDYPTQNADDGGRHIILDAGNPTLGSTVDDESDGQPAREADGDDVNDGSDDEDGVTFSGPLVPGEELTVTVSATADADGLLNGWIDFDGDGSLTGNGEQIATNRTVTAGESITLVIPVPLTATQGITSYARFRFSTEPDLAPTGLAPDGEIEDYALPIREMDYGDAPDIDYHTVYTSDGARHVILPVDNPTLGSVVDAETDGQPNAAANGDDVAGTPDDEDGVSFDSPLVPGEVATITVSAAITGSDGTLNAWIDFGGDGDWGEAGDQIAANRAISAGDSVVITFTIPSTAVQGADTYARFRFSTEPDLTPTGLAPNGEVEDYALNLSDLEYGDLPDGPYPTLFASDGARHTILPVDNPTLGSLVDAERDGQPSTEADGDDVNDGSDDEDGVTFLTPLMQGQAAQIRVAAGSDGYLNAWIDFDGDGLLDTITLTAIDGTPVISTMNDISMTTGVHTFTIQVPDVAISSSVYSRFRFTSYDTGGTLSYTGRAIDGEVEDYVLMSLGNLVWMDGGADGGVRNDGAQNGAEAGIPGVTVELYRYEQTPGVDTPITTTVTDGSGTYRFTGLTPYTYVVHIPASEFGGGRPLEGLTSSTGWGLPDADVDQDQDENGVDEAAPEINGVSSLSVTLSLGDEPSSEDGDANSNLTVDFGFYGGRIGDYVWLEWLRDGLQNGLFETPIPDVVVDLYDASTGAHLTSDTTDASGLYLFDDLPLGVTYTVQLSQVNFTPGGALAPYTPTRYLGGPPLDNTDSNANPDALFNGAGYAVTTTLTTAISEDLTLDFGFVELVSLGNYVWFDVDDDGLADADETGVPGITVELYQDSDGSGDFTPGADEYVGATTTDAGGHYTFTDLLPSLYPTQTYVVVITKTNFSLATGGVLPGYQNSTGHVGGNSDLNDRDHGVVSGTLGAGGLVASQPVSVTVGDEPDGTPVPDGDTDDNSNLTIDFGFYQLSLGDQVWYDDNNNALLDGGENVAASIEVRLYDLADTLLMTSTTDAGGLYTFTGLYPDTGYVVEIVPPAAYTSSIDIATSDDPRNNVNSDDNGVQWDGGNIRSHPITLTAGYTGALGSNTVVTAAGSTHDPTVDFGLVRLVEIGNYVWFDEDHDGTQNDAPDNGFEGVTVTVDYPDGRTFVTTTTASGHYTFVVPIGQVYTVTVVDENFEPGGPLETYTHTLPEVGDDDAVDSDGRPVAGGLVTVTHPITEDNYTFDFGLVRLVSLGNYVWFDVDDSGTAGADEVGVPGVTVELYRDSDTSGDFTPGTDEYVGATATDAAGHYTFTRLYPSLMPAGAYVVVIPDTNFIAGGALEGYVNSTAVYTGNSDLDEHDHGVVSGTLGAGGLVASTPVSVTAGDEPPYADHPDGDSDDSSNLTIDFGFYRLSLGDQVWYDDDDNGRLDVGESVAAGVPVRLYDGTGVTRLMTTTTDASGRYTFTGLSAAAYVVEIVPPATYTSSTDIASSADPNNNVNSDDNGVVLGHEPTSGRGTIRSHPVTLTAGYTGALDNNTVVTLTGSTHDPTVDFGLVQMVALGNLVWFDTGTGGGTANDGIQNGTEPGVANIEVQLFAEGMVPGTDAPIQTTTTDADGRYAFDNLAPGTYFVHIPPTAFQASGPLEGYWSSAGNGTDETTDHDGDENGIDGDDLATTGISSTLYVLAPDSERTGEDQSNYAGNLDDDNVNFTADFGFVELVALGNLVWFDTGTGGGTANDGIQNGTEPGVADVEVQLFAEGMIPGTDAPILTTTTDAAGRYAFDSLVPGTYFVHIPPTAFQAGGPLEGYWSSSGNGTDETTDHDGDENGVDGNDLTTTGISSTLYTLQPNLERTGEDQSNYIGRLADDHVNFTADFGFVELVALGNLVWFDTGTGGGTANDGIQNGTEPGVADVEVQLFADGMVPDTDAPILTTTTDATGRYAFDSLVPGTYFVHIPPTAFQAGGPLAGYVSSTGNGTDETTDHDGDENGIDGNDGDDLATTGISSTLYTLAPDSERTGEDQSNYAGSLDDDNVNFTADFGFYQWLSLGDLVWYDHDDDGVYEPGAGETGVAGVTVELYPAGDVPSQTAPLSTTVTDGDGRYLFTYLNEGGYFVHIPPTVFANGQPLEGYESSTPTEADPNTDQNEDVDENGVPVAVDGAAELGVSSGVVTLTFGSEPLGDDVADIDVTPDVNSNLTVDFGFYRWLSLGDLVWYDDDNDGVYEPGAGETGVAGVTVELYRAGDTPGQTTPLSTTTTDGNGRYLFTDLDQRDYVVHIPPTAFASGQPLAGYESTVPTEPDPNTDWNEDVDENGIPVSTQGAAEAGVSSGIVTLTFDGEPLGDDVADIDDTPDDNSNLTVDFGFYQAPGLAMVKTVDPGVAVPGRPFTYTIRITNTGQATIDPLILTDTLPAAAFNYVLGSGRPSDPDVIAGTTLVWQNVGPLASDDSLAVSFVVTVTPPFTGTYVNVATATGDTPSGPITDTDDIPVTVDEPAVEVDKRLVGWDRERDVITFTIEISNVGPVTLDVIPLMDDYDYRFLKFKQAAPTPDEVVPNPGLLRWHDLTEPSSGFGDNLPPGTYFEVTTVFSIVGDITRTVNTAIVTGVLDTEDNPANDDEDEEPVINIPTGIPLRYLRAAFQADGVQVEWATLTASNVYGFEIHRATRDQFDQARQIGFQASQGSGDGAEYAYLDKDIEPGQRYWYWVVALDNAEGRTRHGPVSATVAPDETQGHRVYLPLVFRH